MGNYTQIFVHLVWSTTGRLPLLTREIEAAAHACIASKCRQLRCRPVAIGGMPDHVHLLAELHPAISVAMLAKEIKGASSYHINHSTIADTPFSWSAGYGAFSVSRRHVADVASYVTTQKARHAASKLSVELERIQLSSSVHGPGLGEL